MEIQIQVIELLDGVEYREIQRMTLDEVLASVFPQRVLHDKLMIAIRKIRDSQEFQKSISVLENNPHHGH